MRYESNFLETQKTTSTGVWYRDGRLLYILRPSLRPDGREEWYGDVQIKENATTIRIDGDNADAVAKRIFGFLRGDIDG